MHLRHRLAAALLAALLALPAWAPTAAPQTAPVMVEQTGPNSLVFNSVFNPSGRTHTAPAAGDLNGDGVLDLVVCVRTSTCFYLRGADGGTIFFDESGWGPSIVGEFFNNQFPRPALVDIDADGDLDMVISAGSLTFFYRNNGTPQAPQFSATGDTGGSMVPNTRLGGGTPEFADLDGDGDFDFIIRVPGSLRTYENTGTPQAPAWTLLRARTTRSTPSQLSFSLGS